MERTFGIEIECVGLAMHAASDALQRAGLPCVVEGYNHRTAAHWKVVPDSSVIGNNGVRGCEIVSPVLRGEQGIADMRKAMTALREAGASVNDNCGFHVHVGAADYDAAALKRLISLCVRFERAIDSLVPATRRGNRNRFCKSNARTLASRRAEALARLVNAHDSIVGVQVALRGDRYHKVNVQPMTTYGTVEFRQHSGTLNGTKAETWVRLVESLVCSAKRSRSMGFQRNGEPSTATSFRYLLLRAPREIHEALIARRAALMAADGRDPRRARPQSRATRAAVDAHAAAYEAAITSEV